MLQDIVVLTGSELISEDLGCADECRLLAVKRTCPIPKSITSEGNNERTSLSSSEPVLRTNGVPKIIMVQQTSNWAK